MEGLQGAGSWELGVFPEDLCHKGGHVSLFGVVQGEERVFLPMRSNKASADTTDPGGCHTAGGGLHPPPQTPMDTILQLEDELWHFSAQPQQDTPPWQLY